MALWRCPHCGAPQPETARCWVCRRSTTTCDTCRNFRRGVAGALGFCGVDRRRLPLVGDEVRACWESGPATVAEDPTSAAPRAAHGFVEVGPSLPAPPTPERPRWSLWHEAD